MTHRLTSVPFRRSCSFCAGVECRHCFGLVFLGSTSSGFRVDGMGPPRCPLAGVPDQPADLGAQQCHLLHMTYRWVLQSERAPPDSGLEPVGPRVGFGGSCPPLSRPCMVSWGATLMVWRRAKKCPHDLLWCAPRTSQHRYCNGRRRASGRIAFAKSCLA